MGVKSMDKLYNTYTELLDNNNDGNEKCAKEIFQQ